MTSANEAEDKHTERHHAWSQPSTSIHKLRRLLVQCCDAVDDCDSALLQACNFCSQFCRVGRQLWPKAPPGIDGAASIDLHTKSCKRHEKTQQKLSFLVKRVDRLDL